MMCCHELFTTYTPCVRNIKIKIADGSLTLVAGKGSIQISDFIVLEFILHVPKLDCSLLSISQLTKQSNCYAKFLTSHYVFQDISSGVTIESVKRYEGLYYFKVTIRVGNLLVVGNFVSISKVIDFML